MGQAKGDPFQKRGAGHACKTTGVERALNIDPPASSYAIMRRQAPTAERTMNPARTCWRVSTTGPELRTAKTPSGHKEPLRTIQQQVGGYDDRPLHRACIPPARTNGGQDEPSGLLHLADRGRRHAGEIVRQQIIRACSYPFVEVDLLELAAVPRLHDLEVLIPRIPNCVPETCGM
jgi:hypothetical protein